MTDPASVVRRELSHGNPGEDSQAAKAPNGVELSDFGVRSEKTRTLSKTFDLSNSLPGEPVRKRKIDYPYSSV